MGAMKPKISVVMIVKNEEEMLARCLESVKGADEIIVCDTGSIDKTIEVAKKYTDKVYDDYKWEDSFAKARNHALSKATGDWILSIDADEFLRDFSAVTNAVDEAVKLGTVLAIDCKLISEADNQMHGFPRLFKRCPEVWWEGVAHNHISVIPQIGSKVEIVYGYSPAHRRDPERTFRILQAEVTKTENAREMFYLGREYWYRSNFKQCVEILEKYVKKAHFLAEKADAYLLLARCYWAMGMGEQARHNCVEAITINPHFKEAVKFMVVLVGRGSGNPIWETNALWWDKAAENSTNTNVLFVRDLTK